MPGSPVRWSQSPQAMQQKHLHCRPGLQLFLRSYVRKFCCGLVQLRLSSNAIVIWHATTRRDLSCKGSSLLEILGIFAPGSLLLNSLLLCCVELPQTIYV